jgi:hypothetical protein
MKPFKSRFFGMLKNTGEDGLAHQEGESRFFALPPEEVADLPAPTGWPARAVQVKATPLDAKAGLTRLRQLWGGDSIMSHLSGASVERMLPYVSFASVPAERELIAQDESGDYLVVLLQGSISVLRKQEWGEVLVLATVNPGEMLGEMSLLDGGVRFSSCITRSECDIAILTAEGLDRMILGEPQIAASFIALLARKLSLRLRIVSARLGGRNT